MTAVTAVIQRVMTGSCQPLTGRVFTHMTRPYDPSLRVRCAALVKTSILLFQHLVPRYLPTLFPFSLDIVSKCQATLIVFRAAILFDGLFAIYWGPGAFVISFSTRFMY
jgi:hypothetical protein